MATRDGGALRSVVGAYGLTLDQRADPIGEERCLRVLDCEETQLHQGDLLRIGARELVLVPFAGEVDRGVVGVARLYEERFDAGKLRCSRR